MPAGGLIAGKVPQALKNRCPDTEVVQTRQDMGASEGDQVLLARKGLGYCQWVLGTQREDKRVVLEEVRSVKKRHEGVSN